MLLFSSYGIEGCGSGLRAARPGRGVAARVDVPVLAALFVAGVVARLRRRAVRGLASDRTTLGARRALGLVLLLPGPATAATVSAQQPSGRTTPPPARTTTDGTSAARRVLTLRDAGAPLNAGSGWSRRRRARPRASTRTPRRRSRLALGGGDDGLAIGDAPTGRCRRTAAPATTFLARGPSDDVCSAAPAATSGAGTARTGSTAAAAPNGSSRRVGRQGGSRPLRGRRDAVTLTPRLDAPLLRPGCERLTAGVLRAVRWSLTAALRLTVRAAPGQRSCRVTIRGPGSTAELGLLRRGTSNVRFATPVGGPSCASSRPRAAGRATRRAAAGPAALAEPAREHVVERRTGPGARAARSRTTPGRGRAASGRTGAGAGSGDPPCGRSGPRPRARAAAARTRGPCPGSSGSLAPARPRLRRARDRCHGWSAMSTPAAAAR